MSSAPSSGGRWSLRGCRASSCRNRRSPAKWSAVVQNTLPFPYRFFLNHCSRQHGGRRPYGAPQDGQRGLVRERGRDGGRLEEDVRVLDHHACQEVQQEGLGNGIMYCIYANVGVVNGMFFFHLH